MKAQDRSNYIIAVGVILCSAVLLIALSYALTGFSWKPRGRKILVDLHDATGVKLHSAVRYAGKTAGMVAEIRYLTAEERAKAADSENAVRVLVRLNEDVPALRQGVTAMLSAETLLGEKFIALAPGEPNARVLPDGAVIQGISVVSIDTVAGSANDAIRKVNDILTSLKADYPSLVPKLADLLNQGSALLGQGSNLVNNADTTILNANGAVTKLKEDYAQLIPKVNSFLAQAQGIATNANQAVLKISALIDRADHLIQTNEGDLK